MIKYNLHDSLIKKINYINYKKKIEIFIELCNWQQHNYRDLDPEMINIVMIFEEVKNFELSIDNYEFDNNEILDVICINDKTTKIMFLTEKDVGTLTVTANKISFVNLE